MNWGSSYDQDLYCLTIGYTSLVGLAGSDLILDVFLIILPLPMVRKLTTPYVVYVPDLLREQIWNLRMANAKKVGVTGIMLLGAAYVSRRSNGCLVSLTSRSSLAASIARLVLYVQT